MPLYEYYCQSCHGIFEEIRQMSDASVPMPCPECGREAPRIMSSFQPFTMREGYPRKIPDKGTYWHMGQEVKSKVKRMKGFEHPELAKPKPKPRPMRGDIAVRQEQARKQRAEVLYKDKWGLKPDGFRSVKAKKVKPERKVV